MRSPTGRVLVRVQLTTLPKLIQQASTHWDQVYQTLRADERHLECLQHRLNAFRQILVLEPALPPEHCPALVAKVQALARQEEALHQQITLERVSCRLLEQVFEDAQRAQSVLLKQWEQTHHRRRQQLQQLLCEICTQLQHAATYLAQEIPGGIVPPIDGW